VTTALEVTNLYTAAIKQGMAGDPRSAQSRAGVLGPSDIGFCRSKATFVTKQTPPSDPIPDVPWAIWLGTAAHQAMAPVLKAAHPDWHVDETRVTATLPSGAEISGTPDVIAPDLNAILDLKTVDGLTWARRNGISRNHAYQRHLYALGAIQAGLLDDSKPVYVGNVYLDRSGKDGLYVSIAEFDPSLTAEVDSWVTDVIYAVQHNQPAAQDLPATVCETICEFYTACRGGVMEDTHDPEFLGDNEEAAAAIKMYVEARDMEAEAKRMKKAAQIRLIGVNGTDGEFQVRWTDVPGSDVPGYFREGYSRLDVRKLRRKNTSS
jgi:hypothetical protein